MNDWYFLLLEDGDRIHSPREYNRHYKERTLTPRKQADAAGNCNLFVMFLFLTNHFFFCRHIFPNKSSHFISSFCV